ncbi:MAG TPA: hypothetical protein VGW12_09410 [Pyrinomonadaceae bacterium]|nr:hypothetical protein [Pyrinomonadaceae bacterium]
MRRLTFAWARTRHGAATAEWRWSVAAALALAALSLAPQVYLWAERGHDWNGAAFYFFFDESAYESYLAALIRGRARLNDPYTGRDAAETAPQPESLFSIQFIPAYVSALPARLFKLSAATVFIILWPLAAFATTLALSRLLRTVSGDERTAAALALFVLCLCTFIQKTVRTLRGLETAYLPLPFLRRYLPALPFALLFIFCLLVWRALTNNESHALTPNEQRAPADDARHASIGDAQRAWLVDACFAGFTFALMVYSYFYLWTTAAAWLACLALLWLASVAPAERRRAARTLLVVISIAALSLAPYAWLLAQRAQTMDAAQALVHTRAPDLFRTSELLGALALFVLIFAARRGRIAWRDRRVLLPASLALTPFVVFNQQLITGRLLQPIHYEQFITNYLSLAALAVSVLLCAGRALTRPRVLACIAILSLGWASFEVFAATRRAAQFNLWTDEARAVYLRLSEIARAEGEFDTAEGRQRRTVFCPDIGLADRLPTVAPQAVLWSPHMFVFSGTTHAEEKERLYRQLYYSNIDAARFADFISRPHPYRTAVFGSVRIINGLAPNRAPVTPADIDAEVRAYAAYIDTFTRERAAQTPLSYIVLTTGQTDLENIDRFYTRDAGERVANYTIYRVNLRHEETMK